MPSARGYALPLVFGLILMLSVVLTTVLFSVGGSVNMTESLLHRRQAFHTAEGVSLAAMELASSKLRSLPLRPNVPLNDPGFPAALQAMLAQHEIDTETFINSATNKPLLTPAGYSVGDIDVFGLGAAQQKELDSGPFNGMLAQVQPLSLSVLVKREHDRSPATQVVIAQIERATISMFQFYVFSDVYLDLDPGGVVSTSGRIHTNQDFCVAGEPEIETVTAAGRILMSNRDGQQCHRRATEANNIRIAIDSTATPARATLTQDHAQAGWASYATTTFRGHVLDSAHNVLPLKMPVSGLPRVQAGANVLAMEQVPPSTPTDTLQPIAAAREENAAVGSASASMRFLVDPMLITEPDDVRAQKFAFQADLRIIDGVWFLRDPANPALIGRAVWSDHPGIGNETHANSENTVIITDQLGQDTIRDGSHEGWASTPQRYSYYGFEPDGAGQHRWARTSGAPPAVISYGLLKKDSAAANVWAPGFYSGGGSVPAISKATKLEHFLWGTRGGIKNGWLEVRSESTAPVSDGPSAVESRRARLLPINFDVAAFIAALKVCSGNELGSLFPATCNNASSGRRFNGIVYISATWPGAMDGLGDNVTTTSGFATLAPFNGTANAPPGVEALTNRELPVQLCRGQAAALPLAPTAPPPANPLPYVPATPQFERCGEVDRNVKGSFPNVVRVFNAQHIRPRVDTPYAGVDVSADALPGGLTIATNLPLIALGDMNTDTTPLRNKNSIPPNDHFVPFLLAGDRFARHSVNWADELANWRDPMNAHIRLASETTQNTEILAGWNPTPTNPLAGHDHSSDGFEDFPRYNESWTCDGRSEFVHYSGSIVVAFASVYERAGANNGEGPVGGYTTCFPRRDEGFDFHLEDPTNQPPGTPQLIAQSIGFWEAR